MGQVKKHIQELADAVENAYNAAVDADWENKPSDHLWEQYRSLKARLDNGEYYEPLF